MLWKALTFQKFTPKSIIVYGSNVGQICIGPFLAFQDRLWSASLFCVSRLQTVHGIMPVDSVFSSVPQYFFFLIDVIKYTNCDEMTMASCLWIVSKVPQFFF